jgi:hypothetical protein
VLKQLANWFKPRRPVRESVAVEFDESEIRVRALNDADPEWNQQVAWSNIRRVCWKDGGMLSSDIVYISLRSPDQVLCFPTEARGGHEAFGALCERGLFPEHVWRRALGNTSGGMFCWPEE